MPSKTSLVMPSRPPRLTVANFQSLLKTSQNAELYEQRFNITPEMAGSILEKRNTSNRTINRNHLQSVIRDIRKGNWVESTGDMVSFSREGVLIDGQHRLKAIVETNMEMPLSFKFGLAKAAQRVKDTGRKRTFGDFVAISEGQNAKRRHERASVARLIYGFLQDQYHPHNYTNNNKPTQSELNGVLEEFHDEISSVVDATAHSDLIRLVIHSYTAFAMFLFRQTPHADRADEFFERLRTGANMGADNPIMVIRNRLSIRDEFRSQKAKDRTIALLVKGWNMWILNQTATNKMRSPEFIPRVLDLTTIGSHEMYVDELAAEEAEAAAA